MKYKYLSLMLAGTIISAGFLQPEIVYAQSANGEPQKIEHRFNREQMRQKMAETIAKKLDLTAEQQEQAKKIREQGKKEIEPLMNEMKDLRQKMDAKRRANMEEFEKILTPEQKAKFEEIKKNAPKHPKHHFKRGDHHHGPHKAPHDINFDKELPENAKVMEVKEIIIEE